MISEQEARLINGHSYRNQHQLSKALWRHHRWNCASIYKTTLWQFSFDSLIALAGKPWGRVDR